MSIQRCQFAGKPGYRWGSKGKCYVSRKGRSRGLKQAAAIRAAGYVENVFCPTGEGGGIDPTCSPVGESKIPYSKLLEKFKAGQPLSDRELAELFRRTPDKLIRRTVLKQLRERKLPVPHRGIISRKLKFTSEPERGYLAPDSPNIDEHRVEAHKSIVAAGGKLDEESASGSRYYTLPDGTKLRVSDHAPNKPTEEWMRRNDVEDVRLDRLKLYIPGVTTDQLVVNAARRRIPLRLDPTRTTTLRKAMIADLRSRFLELKSEGVTAPGQISRGITGWETYWQRYTEQAFLRGLERSWTEARKAMLLPPELRALTRKEFVSALRAQVYEQTGELSARVFAELQKTAQDTATRIARVRADGRTKRLSRVEIDKQIKAEYAIGSRSAERTARTELIRSHADGQILALEQLGVARVGIMVEWTVSGLGTTEKGNPSPCPECAQYEGVVLTLDEARGMIPLHPNCLCSYTPVFDEELLQEEYEQDLEG